MEENKQADTTTPENEVASTIEQSAPKKVVAPRKPAVRKTVVQPEVEAVNVLAELEASDEMLTTDVIVEIENSIYQYSKKLDKKNLKKLKKMKVKVKEKEKKAKDKQKEKEKKAKKKKKDKAKKEKAKKKLKEKKAKKKAAGKKKKSKK
jgi:alpha-galactosidase/6-phospho-beta-glucosidase family protein